MSITAADVAEIVKLLEESSFDELSLQTGDVKISLRRSGAKPRKDVAQVAQVAQVGSESAPAPESGPSLSSGAPTGGDALAEQGDSPDIVAVPSPMLGTFYRAPRPGEAPFVEVGQRVSEETVIGIIEVMKLMNAVRAGVSGEIVQIVAHNAMLVEYGEPLIRVRKD